MSFGGAAAAGKAKATPALPSDGTDGGEDRREPGFLRMLGRARRGTGAGEYEMVARKDDEEEV